MNDYNMSEEVWKDISGYEGRYRISNHGRVYSVLTDIILKQRLNKGYPVVNLTVDCKCKTFSIHRLVALHFVENAENKPEVNHIDENKCNNHASNLMWCTPKENSNWGTRPERVLKVLKINNFRPYSLKQKPHIKVKKLVKKRKNKLKITTKESDKRVIYRVGVSNSKEVYSMDKNSNEILDKFVSVKAAARFYGLRQSNISDVCGGRVKTTGGLKFKYVI